MRGNKNDDVAQGDHCSQAFARTRDEPGGKLRAPGHVGQVVTQDQSTQWKTKGYFFGNARDETAKL